jgi:hypothetical protein
VSTREVINAVAITLILTTAALVLTVVLTGIGDRNRQKVERMTELCVEQGYSAWVNTAGLSICIGEVSR